MTKEIVDAALDLLWVAGRIEFPDRASREKIARAKVVFEPMLRAQHSRKG